ALGDRRFLPQNAEGGGAREIVAAFIAQHYLERPVPGLIVAGEELDAAELEATLSEHAKKPVRVLTRPTADRRAWLEMARENARQALKARLAEQSTQRARLPALREAPLLPDTAQRLERVDISPTIGAAAGRAAGYGGLRTRTHGGRGGGGGGRGTGSDGWAPG